MLILITKKFKLETPNLTSTFWTHPFIKWI